MLWPYFLSEYYIAIQNCKKKFIVKIVKYFPQTLIKIQNLHSSPRRHGRESRQNVILYFPLIYICGNTISACKIHPSRHKTHSRACGICKQSALTSLQYDILRHGPFDILGGGGCWDILEIIFLALILTKKINLLNDRVKKIICLL